MEQFSKALYLESLFDYISIWVIHIGRITFWVMVGSACLILFFRFLLLRLFPAKLSPHLINYPSALRLTLFLGIMLFGLSISALSVVKPDIQFLTKYGEMALKRRDFADALEAYTEIVDSGVVKVEVYNNLAICYLSLNRYREAIDAFHKVQEMAPDTSIYIYTYCAYAHEQLNEPNMAIEHLTKALSMAQSPEQKREIELQLEPLQRQNRSFNSALK